MGKELDTDSLRRLAVCAAVAIGLVYIGENVCEGKNWPIWEQYGPWIAKNKIQAAAVLAVVFYVVSLAVWPEKQRTDSPPPPPEDGFTACP